MSMLHQLPALFAQADGSSQTHMVIVLGITAAVLILPFLIGGALAKSLRMPDYGWKIGLILCTLAAAGCIVAMGKLHYGVDLRGGSILIYELEDEPAAAQDGAGKSGESGNGQKKPTNKVDSEFINRIIERINPSGTKEIVVRPYGDRQIEIIIPETDPLEVERIKKKISTAGALEFRIVATRRPKQRELVAAAEEMANDPIKKRFSEVKDADGNVLGTWVRVDREDKLTNGIRRFKVDVSGEILRNPNTGDIIDVPRGVALAEYLKEQGVNEVDVLMAKDDWNVTGDHLGGVQAGYDDSLNPSVLFQMRGAGSKLFQGLTREYSPDRETGDQWRLGIVLDKRLISAPNIRSVISDRGEITGRFTKEEVNFLVGVLQAGRLTATLKDEPITENQIGSMLGVETIRKGTMAIGISLVAVLIFILIYYRFAGLVASLALLANLLFTLALMILMRAPLTLPGLAGLVLTVGMSVDANVLIFERIREELNRGAALRMAIRNGFSRATTTIVDANLTTLITGIVLYAIGTDQVRGFAVTLILGILMSMFTAIFCARVAFDIAERKRLLSRLNMMQLVGNTHIDFVKKQKLAIAVSLVLIVIGLIGVAGRRQTMFDIDFLGGVSVTMTLEKPMTDAEVRKVLEETLGTMTQENSKVEYTLNRVEVQDKAPNTYWKIDASLEDVDELQQVLVKAFPLARYELKVESVRQVASSGPAGETPATDNQKAPAADTDSKTSRRTDLPADTLYVQAENADPNTASDATDAPRADEPDSKSPTESASENETPKADSETGEQPSEDTPAVTDQPTTTAPTTSTEATTSTETTEPTETSPATSESNAPEGSSEPETPKPVKVQLVQSTAKLAFPGHPISAPTLIEELSDSARAANIPETEFVVAATSKEWKPESNLPFDEWNVTAVATPEQLQSILNTLQNRLESTPIWLSSSKIGGKVAGDTQLIAIAALLASLLGIVAYIWFRFQKLTYGLAAVVALVHDVLITLGAIAVSYWLVGAPGFLQIEEFKISLPVVAAFLTLIGYSLNDTIVVFDRIREVKGKSPNLTSEMINTSINQTLSRTMLTSLTTLLVVLILYFLGGEGIHGFAFALVVGIIVGTYSSIFVASPILLWMAGRAQKPSASPS